MLPGTVGAMANFFDNFPEDDYDELELDRPDLSLSLDQQVGLANAVAAQRRACDGSLSAAQEWARRAGVDWPRLRRELEDNGGYCDCEVVLNVFGGDFDRAFDVGDADPG